MIRHSISRTMVNSLNPDSLIICLFNIHPQFFTHVCRKKRKCFMKYDGVEFDLRLSLQKSGTKRKFMGLLIYNPGSLKQACYFKNFGKSRVFFSLFAIHILQLIHSVFD